MAQCVNSRRDRPSRLSLWLRRTRLTIVGQARKFREFRMLQLFNLAAIAAFLLLGAAMLYLERQEAQFFGNVQRGQEQLIGEIQDGIVGEYDSFSRIDLLANIQTANASVARLFANALNDHSIATYLAHASKLAQECPRPGAVPSSEHRACDDSLRSLLLTQPALPDIDRRVHTLIQGTDILSVSVVDSSGRILYSSSQGRIGGVAEALKERSAVANIQTGWATATRAGVDMGPSDQRALVVTRMALHSSATLGAVEVEVRSDAGKMLDRLRISTQRLRDFNTVYLDRIRQHARDNQAQVERSAAVLLLSVAALAATLLLALHMIVRRGQHTIDRQALVRDRVTEHVLRRERRKIATIASMAAQAEAELKRLFARIAAPTEDATHARTPAIHSLAGGREILLARIRSASDSVAAITALAVPDQPAASMLNQTVRDACDLLQSEAAFRDTRIVVVPQASEDIELPGPERLIAALINLVGVCMSGKYKPRKIVLATTADAGTRCITIDWQQTQDSSADGSSPALSAQPRVALARRFVADLGGSLEYHAHPSPHFAVVLPSAAQAEKERVPAADDADRQELTVPPTQFRHAHLQ